MLCLDLGGLMSNETRKRIVEFSDYDVVWKEKFRNEAVIIGDIFKDNFVCIHHIGSTSIRGIGAKPIIDMLLVVDDINMVDSYNERMEAMGYTPKGEYGIEGRRFMYKGEIDRTHHLHIFEYGHGDVDRHLLFRDYMNTHPEGAKAYEELKRKLAVIYKDDPQVYSENKNEFIKAHDRMAEQWGEDTHWSKSLKKYIGSYAKADIDRSKGQKHPEHDMIYEINYGYIPHTLSGDSEEIDVYILDKNEPIDSCFGFIVAGVHREDDIEEKLAMMTMGYEADRDTVAEKIDFQEKYFKSTIYTDGF